MNDSPWLAEIPLRPAHPPVQTNEHDDIVIIGGGISGVLSAYFTLLYTNKHVSIIEGKTIASGATGHNAGQAIAHFERPLSSLVAEFGDTMTQEALNDINLGWTLLQDVLREIHAENILDTVTGYDGLCYREQFFRQLSNEIIHGGGKLKPGKFLMNRDCSYRNEIPETHLSAIDFVSSSDIASILECAPDVFEAVQTSTRGTLNSALLCEKVLFFLQEKYPERITIYENSPVKEVCIRKTTVDLKIGKSIFKANSVILATNGYKKLKIVDGEDPENSEIDRLLQENVRGLIGFMHGHITNRQKPSATTYYSDLPPDEFGECYYFTTSRNNSVLLNSNQSLFCVGGPSEVLLDTSKYGCSDVFREKYDIELDDFLRTFHPIRQIQPTYSWEGLMGYTKSLMKIIGRDSIHHHLWYNIGCNGTGILTSIFGGWKVGKMLSGEVFRPSVFDPQ